MLECKIGFIGAGQMARALARGLLARGLIAPKQLLTFDPDPNATQEFSRQIPQARSVQNNSELVQKSDVIVLAVKPQSLGSVSQSLPAGSTSDKLFISILAGVPLATLRSALQTNRIVRVMPNTPCLVGHGAAAYSTVPQQDEKSASPDPAGVTPEDEQLVQQLFGAVGIVFAVPERLLDAVTGLSGSGPAFVYTVIEALSDGGVRMGLPRAVAMSLAAQTVAGSAQMVLSTGEHPGVLKDRVASPAGTTIAGLQVIERRGVRSALIDAVEAAALRSRELGSQSG
jgi:pyrroline-5-carboxylate reductase